MLRLLLILTFSVNSYACLKPVSYLREGEKSPCTGFLFSPEKEQEVRLIVELSDLKDNKISLLENVLKTNNEILDLERQQSEKWRESYEKSLTYNNYRDSLNIGLGIVLTVLAGWAINHAGR